MLHAKHDLNRARVYGACMNSITLVLQQGASIGQTLWPIETNDDDPTNLSIDVYVFNEDMQESVSAHNAYVFYGTTQVDVQSV